MCQIFSSTRIDSGSFLQQALRGARLSKEILRQPLLLAPTIWSRKDALPRSWSWAAREEAAQVAKFGSVLICALHGNSVHEWQSERPTVLQQQSGKIQESMIGPAGERRL